MTAKANTQDQTWAVFFRKFSLLEYTLKRYGFIGPAVDKVEVDWNDFADRIRQTFEQSLQQNESLRESVEFVETAPPKKLVPASAQEGAWVCWRDAPPSQGSRLPDLLVYLRRIRNNLFHGEKPGVFVGGASGRDVELLQHGTAILQELERILVTSVIPKHRHSRVPT